MSALFDITGQYRWRLERIIENPTGNATAGFIMVNPSKAGAEVNDPTITKLIGFSRRLGFSKIIVGNKFAHVATDVKELASVEDPVGPENDTHIDLIIHEADLIIVAWGPLGKLPKPLRHRWLRIVKIAEQRQRPLFCLGTAQDGQPRHPLMLAYSTPLQKWEPPR